MDAKLWLVLWRNTRVAFANSNAQVIFCQRRVDASCDAAHRTPTLSPLSRPLPPDPLTPRPTPPPHPAPLSSVSRSFVHYFLLHPNLIYCKPHRHCPSLRPSLATAHLSPSPSSPVCASPASRLVTLVAPSHHRHDYTLLRAPVFCPIACHPPQLQFHNISLLILLHIAEPTIHSYHSLKHTLPPSLLPPPPVRDCATSDTHAAGHCSISDPFAHCASAKMTVHPITSPAPLHHQTTTTSTALTTALSHPPISNSQPPTPPPPLHSTRPSHLNNQHSLLARPLPHPRLGSAVPPRGTVYVVERLGRFSRLLYHSKGSPLLPIVDRVVAAYATRRVDFNTPNAGLVVPTQTNRRLSVSAAWSILLVDPKRLAYTNRNVDVDRFVHMLVHARLRDALVSRTDAQITRLEDPNALAHLSDSVRVTIDATASKYGLSCPTFNVVSIQPHGTNHVVPLAPPQRSLNLAYTYPSDYAHHHTETDSVLPELPLETQPFPRHFQHTQTPLLPLHSMSPLTPLPPSHRPGTPTFPTVLIRHAHTMPNMITRPALGAPPPPAQPQPSDQTSRIPRSNSMPTPGFPAPHVYPQPPSPPRKSTPTNHTRSISPTQQPPRSRTPNGHTTIPPSRSFPPLAPRTPPPLGPRQTLYAPPPSPSDKSDPLAVTTSTLMLPSLVSRALHDRIMPTALEMTSTSSPDDRSIPPPSADSSPTLARHLHALPPTPSAELPSSDGSDILNDDASVSALSQHRALQPTLPGLDDEDLQHHATEVGDTTAPVQSPQTDDTNDLYQDAIDRSFPNVLSRSTKGGSASRQPVSTHEQRDASSDVPSSFRTQSGENDFVSDEETPERENEHTNGFREVDPRSPDDTISAASSFNPRQQSFANPSSELFEESAPQSLLYSIVGKADRVLKSAGASMSTDLLDGPLRRIQFPSQAPRLRDLTPSQPTSREIKSQASENSAPGATIVAAATLTAATAGAAVLASASSSTSAPARANPPPRAPTPVSGPGSAPTPVSTRAPPAGRPSVPASSSGSGPATPATASGVSLVPVPPVVPAIAYPQSTTSPSAAVQAPPPPQPQPSMKSPRNAVRRLVGARTLPASQIGARSSSDSEMHSRSERNQGSTKSVADSARAVAAAATGAGIGVAATSATGKSHRSHIPAGSGEDDYDDEEFDEIDDVLRSKEEEDLLARDEHARREKLMSMLDRSGAGPSRAYGSRYPRTGASSLPPEVDSSDDGSTDMWVDGASDSERENFDDEAMARRAASNTRRRRKSSHHRRTSRSRQYEEEDVGDVSSDDDICLECGHTPRQYESYKYAGHREHRDHREGRSHVRTRRASESDRDLSEGSSRKSRSRSGKSSKKSSERSTDGRRSDHHSKERGHKSKKSKEGRIEKEHSTSSKSRGSEKKRSHSKQRSGKKSGRDDHERSRKDSKVKTSGRHRKGISSAPERSESPVLKPIYRHRLPESESGEENPIPWYCEGQSAAEDTDPEDMPRRRSSDSEGRMYSNRSGGGKPFSSYGRRNRYGRRHRAQHNRVVTFLHDEY